MKIYTKKDKKAKEDWRNAEAAIENFDKQIKKLTNEIKGKEGGIFSKKQEGLEEQTVKKTEEESKEIDAMMERSKEQFKTGEFTDLKKREEEI